MPGTVFIVQGDITDFQADAVVCSSSTHLANQGLTFAAFSARFAWYEAAYSALRQSLPMLNDRGRRTNQGDAFWMNPPDSTDRLKGVVVVAATGGKESIGERAALAARNAIRVAVENLRCLQPESTSGRRWLIALPALGLGMGGYSRELRSAVKEMVQSAANEIRQVESTSGDEIDVVFVAFTTINYRLLIDARRELGAEPPCPLPTAESKRLLQSMRERRCVLFVGAGLSRGAGYPDWSELLRDLAADLSIDASKLPRDSHGQLSVDLCLDLAQWYVDKLGREKLVERVYDLFGTRSANASVRPSLAHYLLLSTPFRLGLTTNYDDLLERTLNNLRRNPEVVCRPEQVGLTGQTDRPCIVKLHGDANHRTEVVLTRDDFDGFFQNHPVTTALLQGLLLNHTFLFVGYDLRDPNTRQIYSGVARLLKTAGTRAFSVAVRDEDTTSRFYEEQWARQGLITLRMPGPDRIDASLRFFDWLSRETCDLQTYLHPDLRKDPHGTADGADALRLLLFQACDVVREKLNKPLAVGESRIVASLAELLSSLGWKWSASEWEALADVAASATEKQQLIQRALASAEQVGEIQRLEDRLRNLGDAC